MTDRIVPVLTLIAALALLPAPGGAETYRWVDDQGNVTYSDRPPQPREPGAATAPDPRASELRSPEVKAPDPTPRSRDAKATVPPTPIPRAGPTKLDELLELSRSDAIQTFTPTRATIAMMLAADTCALAMGR